MAFGIIAIIIMLCTMDMDYTDIWRYLKQAGIYFPLILDLWLVIYWVNTVSWWLIMVSTMNRTTPASYKTFACWR